MHEIRLRGPWRFAETQPDGIQHGKAVVFPTDWSQLVSAEAKSAYFFRRFNQPTGLQHEQRVWLIIANVTGEVTVKINSQQPPLLRQSGSGLAQDDSAGDIRADITDLLQPHNELEIEYKVAKPGAACVGEICLAIEDPGT